MKEWIWYEDSGINYWSESIEWEISIKNQGMQLVTAKVSGTWNQSSWYQWFGA